MKISKSQLKRIIKEELESVLNEAPDNASAKKAFMKAIRVRLEGKRDTIAEDNLVSFLGMPREEEKEKIQLINKIFDLIYWFRPQEEKDVEQRYIKGAKLIDQYISLS